MLENNAAAVLVAEQDEMSNMYLTFNLGTETYGLQIRHILQIIGMQEITQMPEMPPYMKGYINLRGSIIPVVSIRKRFGLPEVEYNERTCIIVVHIGEKDIGLIVDEIQEAITIEQDHISDPPETGLRELSRYIMGIARLSDTDDATAVLIDVQKLFKAGDI